MGLGISCWGFNGVILSFESCFRLSVGYFIGIERLREIVGGICFFFNSGISGFKGYFGFVGS